MTPNEEPRLVNLHDIAEIEIFVLKRLRELTLGDHLSVFSGPGFDFVGLRDWQPGDRVTTVDWAQSSLNNFSPLVIREYDQSSTATIVTVADGSLSTRCGTTGATTAAAIARAVATIGLSAVFGQDLFGLVTVGEGFRPLAAARPRIGKPHVLYCLDLYEGRHAAEPPEAGEDAAATIGRFLRKRSVVPVVSDFLFPDAPAIMRDLSRLNASHDVFLMMVDARAAFQFADVPGGWVETVDIETGERLVLSRREFGRLGDRIEAWQEHVASVARDRDLDVLRVGSTPGAMETALVEFMAERRLRHVA